MKILDKQTAKLISRITENLPAINSRVMQIWIDDSKGLQDILSKLDLSSELTVHVNRRLKPSYPKWISEVKFSNYECSGPTEYNLSELESWLHNGQKGGKMVPEGFDILKCLQFIEKIFDKCLNLQDGYAIQAKGPVIFRKLFKGKNLFLWKSVVYNNGSLSFVPYLHEDCGDIKINWTLLNEPRSSSDIAPYFSK